MPLKCAEHTPWRVMRSLPRPLIVVFVDYHGGGTLAHFYVVDARFFPAIGAVNTELTGMANAVHVREHLLSRLA
jgi:hypothetical protein